jgi:hypothetical protein
MSVYRLVCQAVRLNKIARVASLPAVRCRLALGCVCFNGSLPWHCSLLQERDLDR